RVVICRRCFGCWLGLSSLEQDVIEGENPVRDWCQHPCKALSTSRVVWECSSKLVVNFI
ncbi:hypothetical protein LY89DRAFT_662469, partial [Mollisia scopiformis]